MSHNARHVEVAHVTDALKQTPQVAVSENTDHSSGFVTDRGDTDLFSGDLMQRIHHARVDPDDRYSISSSHDVPHISQKLAAQRTARMSPRKILGPEPARIETRNRKRITHREHRRGRRCRR